MNDPSPSNNWHTAVNGCTIVMCKRELVYEIGQKIGIRTTPICTLMIIDTRLHQVLSQTTQSILLNQEDFR